MDPSVRVLSSILFHAMASLVSTDGPIDDDAFARCILQCIYLSISSRATRDATAAGQDAGRRRRRLVHAGPDDSQARPISQPTRSVSHPASRSRPSIPQRAARVQASSWIQCCFCTPRSLPRSIDQRQDGYVVPTAGVSRDKTQKEKFAMSWPNRESRLDIARRQGHEMAAFSSVMHALLPRTLISSSVVVGAMDHAVCHRSSIY